jgi:ATP-dependent RNA helicase RhlE
MSFQSLALPEALLKALDQVGYTHPTPIQEQAIPGILAGKDLLAQSHTGTGKTAAFALPLLALMEDRPRRSHAHTLVLTPTRELALQVAEAFKKYGHFMRYRPKVHTLIGGEDRELQQEALEWGADVLVATPGRLLHLLEQDPILLKSLEAWVLDEADKMLSLGFMEELDAIINHLQTRPQTLLFSATFPDKIQGLIEKTLTDPLTIHIEQTEMNLDAIAQRAIVVDRDHRGRLLRHLCKTEQWERTLVFVASKRGAANLSQKLNKAGISSIAFHGDLSQSARIQALAQFEQKQAKVLIATDIAARGLDFNDITHVVNFDLPRSPADYIHRAGRTARAGKTGAALSFIDHESAAHFELIEKRAQIQLLREQIEGFEPAPENTLPSKKQRGKGNAPVKGKRKSKKDKQREALLLDLNNEKMNT